MSSSPRRVIAREGGRKHSRRRSSTRSRTRCGSGGGRSSCPRPVLQAREKIELAGSCQRSGATAKGRQRRGWEKALCDVFRVDEITYAFFPDLNHGRDDGTPAHARGRASFRRSSPESGASRGVSRSPTKLARRRRGSRSDALSQSCSLHLSRLSRSLLRLGLLALSRGGFARRDPRSVGCRGGEKPRRETP